MKTILVVDDEESLRKVIASTLTQRGYRVLQAENGLQGLEVARENLPDLIISDVYMENMNGFIMVEMLRDDPPTATIPVIMMTGAAQGAGAWQAYEDIEYLEKGFAMDVLIKTIEDLLGRKGARTS
ncbi:MAG: response regulator [Ignavibacteria bacterium]|nr:response regulator [Ignavibacteria bacterium]